MNQFLKKIAFAIPFLLSYGWFLQLLNPLLVQGSNVLDFGSASFWQLPLVALALLMAGSFYAITATLSDDWWYVLGVAIVSMILPMIFLSAQSGWILALGGLVAQLVGFAFLHLRMESYLTFRTSEVVLPAVKNFIFFVLLSATVVYFLNISMHIKTRGFELPDQLINLAVDLASGGQTTTTTQPTTPTLSAQQIEELRNNPQLLRQAGLDPSVLDNLDLSGAAQQTSNSVIKQAVKNQFNTAVQPYTWLVPWFLALIFYFGVSSFASLGLFIPVIVIWLTFALLKKGKVIQFQKETREVEKLVV